MVTFGIVIFGMVSLGMVSVASSTWWEWQPSHNCSRFFEKPQVFPAVRDLADYRPLYSCKRLPCRFHGFFVAVGLYQVDDVVRTFTLDDVVPELFCVAGVSQHINLIVALLYSRWLVSQILHIPPLAGQAPACGK